MNPDSYPENAGLTLIELLIALAVTGIVAVAIYTAYESQVRLQVAQEVALENQQGMRAALSIMAREIRTAGADPTGNADSEIIVANNDELHFTRDITGDDNIYDGDTEDTNEKIRYAINSNGHLGRATGGGGAGLQSILENTDAVDFVYLDRDGDTLNPGVSNVPSAELDQIRQVQITIVAHSGQSERGLLQRYRDSAAYVNQQGAEIFKANDTKRRLRMTTTVTCRNMGTGM